MLVFRVLVAGTLQDPPQGWRHTAHANDVLKDPFRARGGVDRADQSGHAANGFYGAVAASTPGQTLIALASARQHRPAWSARAAVDRLELVSRFHTALLADSDNVRDVLVAEGLPCTLAQRVVAGILDDTAPTAVAMAVADSERRHAARGRVVSLRRVPHGVVALQPDYRDPGGGVTAGVWALATGNAVVVNAHPVRPLATAYVFHRLVQPLLASVGAPGVLSVLSTLSGGFLSDAVESDTCDAVWFQGWPDTGGWVRQQALNASKTAILDLHGAPDGVLVWRDADVPAAVEAIAERFHASGQLPLAPRYTLVHPDVADQVVDLLSGHAQAMLPGLPSTPGVILNELTHREAFSWAVEHAVTVVGAKLAAGGRLVGLDGAERANGVFAEPTVVWASSRGAEEMSCIADASAAYPLMPVVVLDESRDDAQRLARAVWFMNDRRGAVRNTLWSSSADVIALFAADVRSGTIININDSCSRRLPGMPAMGGTGEFAGSVPDAGLPWVQATRLRAVADGTALGGRVLNT